MTRFTITPGLPEEAGVLSALAHTAKAHWGYARAWMDQWRDDLTVTPEDLQKHATFVARFQEPAGFAMVKSLGTRWDLEHLWVHPLHMGSGLGSALFKHCVAWCRARGGEELVILSDPYALDFYLKMGCRKSKDVPSSIPGRTLPEVIFALS